MVNPPPRKIPAIESMYPIIAVLGSRRLTMTAEAHGWRSIARRAERMRLHGDRLPVAVVGGRIDLGDDEVDHAVEQVFLSAHMAVERRPRRPAPGRDGACSAPRSLAIGELHRPVDHARD